jgi:hypothetical protein
MIRLGNLIANMVDIHMGGYTGDNSRSRNQSNKEILKMKNF